MSRMKKTRITNSIFRIVSIALCTVPLSLAVSTEALAYSSGISLRTEEGCTCHVNQSDATSITLLSESGSLQVEPGESLTLTLVVAHASKQAAGIDIAMVDENDMPAGVWTLKAGENLKVASGELVHTMPKTFVNGTTSFTFTWTAPSMAGTYTLRAAANAVNRNGNNTGDEYNLFSQDITVGAVTDVREGSVTANKNLQSVEVFPNPVLANIATVGVRYRLANGQDVTVDVYDANGRIVLSATPVYKAAGEHSIEFDTRAMSNGMYVVFVHAGNERLVRHISVAK